MTDRIYLDHITATPPCPQAIRVQLPFFEESFGAATSPHLMGQELFRYIESSKQQLRELVGATAEEQFVFTASGAEAVSIAIHSAYQFLSKQGGKNHFIARAIDEAPSVLAMKNLEDEGCFLHLVPPSKRGFITTDALIDAISPRTSLVSMSWVCPLTGVIQPLEEIAEVCQERGIWLHVDATHIIGKMHVAFSELPIDILTFHGNGFSAPQGCGALFAKKAIQLRPIVFGDMLNVPMLVALGEAANSARETESLYCTEVARMRDHFEESVREVYPEAIVLFKDEERIPHVAAIAFSGIHAELLCFALSRKGVFASMGGTPFPQMERVLQVCSIDPELARTALCFSFSKDTHDAELERAIQIIGEVTKRLRRLSKAVCV